MHKEKPSKTAYKVALNIIALGSKAGMEEILPPCIVEASKKLLIASGAAKPKIVNWASSQRALAGFRTALIKTGLPSLNQPRKNIYAK